MIQLFIWAAALKHCALELSDETKSKMYVNVSIKEIHDKHRQKNKCTASANLECLTRYPGQ